MEAATMLALASPTTPLANQVAGHDGVMADASGSLVIKLIPQPALAREIAFYQLLNESPRSSPLRKLKPFIPRFFGTLRLEGRIQGDGSVKDDIPEKAEVPESIVIENLSNGFIHPNILDVKLGTVLHELTASEEKRNRMEKQARETTTRESGIRLTGFQAEFVATSSYGLHFRLTIKTWHEPSATYIITPKTFGKTITVAQLPLGIRRFFPLPQDTIESLSPPRSIAPSTIIRTSAEGVLPATQDVTAQPGTDAIAASTTADQPTTITVETFTNHAVPAKHLLRLIDMIDEQLEKLEQILGTLEMRFVGGSVLIVYEGYTERLGQAIERYESKPPPFADDMQPSLRIAPGQGSLDDRDGDEDLGMSDLSDDNNDSDDDDEEDDDDDGRKEEERLRRRTPAVSVKMIDFAHTWLAQGEGPDEGVLLGLKTLRGLLSGRRREIQDAVRGWTSWPIGSTRVNYTPAIDESDDA